MPHIILECCKKNAFAYRGPVLGNALPENIKKCETQNCFKQCQTTRSRTIDAIFMIPMYIIL